LSFLAHLNISVRVLPKDFVQYPSFFGGSSLNMYSIIVVLSIEKERDEKGIDKEDLPEEGNIKKIVERRKVEIDIDKYYEIDKNKLAFKTDQNGEIKGSYKLTHSTQKDEKKIIYAFLEDDNSPILIDIDGQKEQYHIVEVPKNGERKVNFTLTDIPSGDHIVYIFGEKYLEKDVQDELGIKQTQEAVTQNYFALKVLNKRAKSSTIEENYTRLKKVGDSKTGMNILELYEDKSFSKEVDIIENNHEYYLALNNPSKYKLKSHLKLISEYGIEELKKVIVPENSKVILPITLERIIDTETVRFILVGKPIEDIDVTFPARIIEKSKRYFVNKK